MCSEDRDDSQTFPPGFVADPRFHEPVSAGAAGLKPGDAFARDRLRRAYEVIAIEGQRVRYKTSGAVDGSEGHFPTWDSIIPLLRVPAAPRMYQHRSGGLLCHIDESVGETPAWAMPSEIPDYFWFMDLSADGRARDLARPPVWLIWTWIDGEDPMVHATLDPAVAERVRARGGDVQTVKP